MNPGSLDPMDQQTTAAEGISRRGAMTRIAAGGLAATLAARGGFARAQDATPAGGATPVAAEVPALIQAWLDAWVSDDPATNVAALYVVEGRYEDAATGRNGEGLGVASTIGRMVAGLSDISLDLGFANGTAEFGVAEYVLNATNQGFVPNAATGETFSARLVTVFQFTGDLIQRSATYYDFRGIALQLGEPSETGAATPAATPAP